MRDALACNELGFRVAAAWGGWVDTGWSVCITDIVN